MVFGNFGCFGSELEVMTGLSDLEVWPRVLDWGLWIRNE